MNVTFARTQPLSPGFAERRSSPRRLAATAAAILAAAALAAALGAAAPARAAFPGTNGKIALSPFRSHVATVYTVNPDGTDYKKLADGGAPAWSPDGNTLAYAAIPPDETELGQNDLEIFISAPDGSGARQLTRNTEDDDRPAFSPDGSRIVFQRDGERIIRDGPAADILVMNADGSGETNLTPDSLAKDVDPKWCGNRIAFASNRDGDFDLYTMAPDGSGQQLVTVSPFDDLAPDWLADCTRIVFHRGDPRTQHELPGEDETPATDENIYAIDPDGTDETPLATDGGDAEQPAYSPDGTRIVFSLRPFSPGCFCTSHHLYTMNADGSAVSRLGFTLFADPVLPDWQPLRGDPTPPPGSIAGKVTDAKTKQGIGGATVDCANGGVTTTASDGSYSIADVSAGTYTCTASAAGYQPKSHTVTVTSGKTTTANFALRKSRR